MENIVYAIVASLSVALGVWFYRMPENVIRVQIRFYEFINWRIEPISMEKEIRNIRLMGLIVILFVVIWTFFHFFLSSL